jgi:hypothetical protein
MPVKPPMDTGKNDTVTDKVMMLEHVQSQYKCAHCNFESKYKRGLKTHMGHKHKDPEDIEMVREPETKDKSLELLVAEEGREDQSQPLANSTINMEESMTVPNPSNTKCDEKPEAINCVSITHKISVNAKKNIDEIRKELTFFKPWDTRQIRLDFSVEKESEMFSAELTIQREDFLEDFNVSLAASILEYLP